MLYLNNFNENVKAMEEKINQRVNEFFSETKKQDWRKKKGRKRNKI